LVLGCGFLEAVYQEALEKEFTSQGMPFKSQPAIQLFYKGSLLDKTYQTDFVCYEQVIVEIKAVSYLSGIEEAQLINYLKASNFEVDLLLNFGFQSLEYKRFVYNL
jgi:GxxExxY protein